MTHWRLIVVTFSIGLVLGVGTAVGARKASDVYERLTDRLERIEGYITQLDRMFKNR